MDVELLKNRIVSLLKFNGKSEWTTNYKQQMMQKKPAQEQKLASEKLIINL